MADGASAGHLRTTGSSPEEWSQRAAGLLKNGVYEQAIKIYLQVVHWQTHLQ